MFNPPSLPEDDPGQVFTAPITPRARPGSSALSPPEPCPAPLHAQPSSPRAAPPRSPGGGIRSPDRYPEPGESFPSAGPSQRPHRGPPGPRGAQSVQAPLRPMLARSPGAFRPLRTPGAAPYLVLGVSGPAGAAPGPQPRLAHAGPAAPRRRRQGATPHRRNRRPPIGRRGGARARGGWPRPGVPAAPAANGRRGMGEGRGFGVRHGGAQAYPDGGGRHDVWRGNVPGRCEKREGFVFRDKRACVMAVVRSAHGALGEARHRVVRTARPCARHRRRCRHLCAARQDADLCNWRGDWLPPHGGAGLVGRAVL